MPTMTLLIASAPSHGEVRGPTAIQKEGGDSFDGSEVVDLHLFERYLDPELLLQVQHQLHEPQGIQHAGFQQVRLWRRDLEVKAFQEPGGDSSLDSGRVGHFSDLLMLRREEIEPQAVVRPAIDVVTLALPADDPEVETQRDPDGGIGGLGVDGPAINRVEPEIAKDQREHRS